MTMIDIDDIRSYLDDKIAEQDRAIAEAGHREVTDLTRVADRARQRLLQEIRKDLEWIEVDGYTPKTFTVGGPDPYPASTIDTWCGSRAPDGGQVCTALKGHKHDHVAAGPSHVVAVWPIDAGSLDALADEYGDPR